LGLENVDGGGVWRETDVGGTPVDASGTINQGDDIAGPFSGVAELGGKLGQSRKVRTCLAKQFFRFGFGRDASAAESCTVDTLTTAFDGSLDYRGLMLRLVSSDAFQYRTE
jgi:hypothetical protein